MAVTEPTKALPIWVELEYADGALAVALWEAQRYPQRAAAADEDSVGKSVQAPAWVWATTAGAVEIWDVRQVL